MQKAAARQSSIDDWNMLRVLRTFYNQVVEKFGSLYYIAEISIIVYDNDSFMDLRFNLGAEDGSHHKVVAMISTDPNADYDIQWRILKKKTVIPPDFLEVVYEAFLVAIQGVIECTKGALISQVTYYSFSGDFPEFKVKKHPTESGYTITIGEKDFL